MRSDPWIRTFLLNITRLLPMFISACPAFANTIVHTVYGASGLVGGGLQLRWNETERGWISESRVTHYQSHGFCNSLIEQQQLFALREMVDRKILTAEQAAMYASIGAELAPRRVSFFEYVHAGQIQATLWSVSGQDLGLGRETNPLPWMLERKWQSLGTQISRKTFPFLWEWGRASQKDDGDINALIDFAVQKAVRELGTLGGRIEQAAVTIHAISPAHTVSYLRRFPGTQISANPVREGDSILLIPLAQILASHPLAKSSGIVRDLGAHMPNPRYSGEFFAQLIDTFRGTLWTEANWQGPQSHSRHPLVIQDFSPWGTNSVHAQLREIGISESASRDVMERLLQMPFTKRLSGIGRYVDTVVPPGPSSLARARNATEVSGLDRKQLSEDPYYLYRVLFAVASVKLHQAKAIFPELSTRDLWAALITTRAPIALASRDPALNRAILALKPDLTEDWPVESMPADIPLSFRAILMEDAGSTTQVHYFSYGRILAMTDEKTGLDETFESSRAHLIRGQFQADHDFLDPDLY